MIVFNVMTNSVLYGGKLGKNSIEIVVEELTLESTVKDLITNDKVLAKLNKIFGDKLGEPLSNETGKSFIDRFRLIANGNDALASLGQTLKNIGHEDVEDYVLIERRSSTTTANPGTFQIFPDNYNVHQTPVTNMIQNDADSTDEPDERDDADNNPPKPRGNQVL